jgi:PRTRC genetic system protein A
MEKSSMNLTPDVTADPRDALLWSLAPTVTAPLFGPPLASLTGSGHRFIFAQNGIWLELSRPWIYVLTPVSSAISVKVPAGELTQKIQLRKSLPLPMVQQFRDVAMQLSDREQAAFITMTEDQVFHLRQVDVVHNSDSGIHYNCPALAPGEEVVVDMHSHAHHDADFSPIDDQDDAEMVVISLVVGNCDQVQPSFAMRLCVLGKFINLNIPRELTHDPLLQS